MRGADGRPVQYYAVVLLPGEPVEPETAAQWIRAARPAADGRFEIPRLRPGRYVAAALDALEPGRQYAPEFQQQLRRGAPAFRVEDGQTVTLDLVLTISP